MFILATLQRLDMTWALAICTQRTTLNIWALSNCINSSAYCLVTWLIYKQRQNGHFLDRSLCLQLQLDMTWALAICTQRATLNIWALSIFINSQPKVACSSAYCLVTCLIYKHRCWFWAPSFCMSWEFGSLLLWFRLLLSSACNYGGCLPQK